MSRPWILVPFVDAVHPETVAAVGDCGAFAQYLETSEPDGYWKALASMWAAGNTFIVLEQDKVPEPGLLQELWDCPQQWCTVPTPTRDSGEPAGYPSLACTKFHRDLIAAEPVLLDEVARLDLGYGEQDWSRLDLAMAGLLLGRYHICHYHTGVVRHLHDSLVSA